MAKHDGRGRRELALHTQQVRMADSSCVDLNKRFIGPELAEDDGLQSHRPVWLTHHDSTCYSRHSEYFVATSGVGALESFLGIARSIFIPTSCFETLNPARTDVGFADLLPSFPSA